ncbi:MAG: hypothetical protein CSA36_07120 [Draconibacterium sp.]|nr:MAG: hypothetical protein CSA36_07120 [Draconibacterium sp.]
MTEAERNAFERKLQKHPFEAEALEGLKHFLASETESDLQDLESKIYRRSKKTKLRMWAAAATVLLLITAGTLWFQLIKRAPITEMAETKNVQKEQTPEDLFVTNEIAIDEEIPTAGQEKDNMPLTEAKTRNNNTATIAEEKELPEPQESVSEAEEISAIKAEAPSIADNEAQDTKTMQVLNKSKKQATTASARKGMVVSAEDSMPLPGVSVVQKATKNASINDKNSSFSPPQKTGEDGRITNNFIGKNKVKYVSENDSGTNTFLQASPQSQDEVVVVGFAKQHKRKSKSDSLLATDDGNTPPKPEGGMGNYIEYLNKHATLPDTFPFNREVVKLELTISETGEISDIKNKNNANQKVFDIAKKLIEDGPQWQPKIDNGIPATSKIPLKIVFRKNK